MPACPARAPRNRAALSRGALRIVIATSAFGEGIDLPDVRYVVLYHLNFNFTEFNQQSGAPAATATAAEIHLLFGETTGGSTSSSSNGRAVAARRCATSIARCGRLAGGGVLRMTFVDIARDAGSR